MKKFKAYWKIQLSELEEELRKIQSVEELKEFINSVEILIEKLTKKLAYVYPIPDKFEAHLVSANLLSVYFDMGSFLESFEDCLRHKKAKSEDFWKEWFKKEKKYAEKFLPFPPELLLELPENYKKKIIKQYKNLTSLERALYNETQRLDLASYFKTEIDHHFLN